MHPLYLLTSFLALAFGPMPSCADLGSYFEFVQPAQGTEWQNGKANPIIWKKGLLDGVLMFDLEIARLSQDGLIKVALNVPANSGSLNVELQDVPAADDYYLLFINATHGGMYAISPRFTILDAGATVDSSASASAPVSSASTISVSGGPNPTARFVQTFPVISGALAWRLDASAQMSMWGVAGAAVAAVAGAAWTVL